MKFIILATMAKVIIIISSKAMCIIITIIRNVRLKYLKKIGL